MRHTDIGTFTVNWLDPISVAAALYGEGFDALKHLEVRPDGVLWLYCPDCSIPISTQAEESTARYRLPHPRFKRPPLMKTESPSAYELYMGYGP